MMTFWRFEIGLWRSPNEVLKLKDYFELSYTMAPCGCRILTVSRIYFIFFGDECYYEIKKASKESK